MVHTTFILDLTCRTRGAATSLEACQHLEDGNWEMLAAYSEREGERTASMLSREDGRVTAHVAGSGPSVCDWAVAARQSRGEHLVFLQPGDCPRPDALTLWRDELDLRRDATWVLGATHGAPYNDWWFQRDQAASAAALLVLGAAFPECTALVPRRAWLEVAEQFPETRSRASRANAWIGMAFLFRPALLPAVVAAAAAEPVQADPEGLAAMLEGLARRDPPMAARLMADVSRLGSGMRIAHQTMVEAMQTTERCLGRTPSVSADAADWLRRGRVFSALFERGERPVWIWGAGQLGLQALAFLRRHSIPVEGFLDRDDRRDGDRWGDLMVHHVHALDAMAAPLVVVASMHHADIADTLAARGWQEGREFVVYQQDTPWVHEQAASR